MLCIANCSNVAIQFKEPFTVRLWRWHSNVRLTKLHCIYTGQHKLCTDTNTVLEIVKATSFYRTVMRYFTGRCFDGFLLLKAVV